MKAGTGQSGAVEEDCVDARQQSSQAPAGESHFAVQGAVEQVPAERAGPPIPTRHGNNEHSAPERSPQPIASTAWVTVVWARSAMAVHLRRGRVSEELARLAVILQERCSGLGITWGL